MEVRRNISSIIGYIVLILCASLLLSGCGETPEPGDGEKDLPDLVVYSASLDPPSFKDGTQVTLKYIIKNEGTVKAEPRPAWTIATTYHGSKVIAPGAPGTSLDPGVTTPTKILVLELFCDEKIEIIVDPNNDIKESDENNTWSMTLDSTICEEDPLIGPGVTGFEVTPLNDSYTITSKHSSKCLSLIIPGGFYENNPVQQWDCSHIHMGLQKSWLIEWDNQNKSFRLVSIFSGKCMEVDMSSGGKNNGDKIQQASCDGGKNQEWKYKTINVGYIQIISAHSGKCLDVNLNPNGGTMDGDMVQQWDCIQNQSNQLWELKKISAPNPPLDTGEGLLCNVCNPNDVKCKGAGAKCIYTTNQQYICGQACNNVQPCPIGYYCNTNIGQCVPQGEECPYKSP